MRSAVYTTSLLVVLLLSANASAASVVSDYCTKNRCVETAVDAIASVFRGMEIRVSPAEISAYNCKKSDFLNLTVTSPLLSTDSDISVNGQVVCELKGSVLPKTEVCVFSLEGGPGGAEGYDNVMINVIAKSDAGILSQQKELSKNFGIRMNHLVSGEENSVLASAKSAEISLAAAYSKIVDYENSGYNMTSVRRIMADSENKMAEGKEGLRKCNFNDAASDYKNSKRIADAALREAAGEKNGQDNEKLSMITGKVFSGATNPVLAILLISMVLLGYRLYKERNKKGAKLDL